MRTIKDELMTLAAQKVSDAVEARLHFGDETANQLLREAAELYHRAGEDGEVQACRMLIVTR